MSRILVTGARGAIGRCVVREAGARGHEVAGLGHGNWTGDSELPPIDVWINGTVAAGNLCALVDRFGLPDLIIHLAGGSAVGPSIERPAEDFQRTVGSSQQLLEWIRTHAPRARLVVASSAAVYGGEHSGSIPESAACHPASPYGTHKAMMEQLCASYGRQFGLAIVIVRLFSVYGPGLRKQLIWDLTQRLKAGELRPVLGGTGLETRDFVHIHDAATMLLDALALAADTVAIVNGCSGIATPTSHVAALVARGWPGAGIGFSGSSRNGDPQHLVGDATHARGCGLAAQQDLETGVAQTVAWIRNAGGVKN